MGHPAVHPNLFSHSSASLWGLLSCLWRRTSSSVLYNLVKHGIDLPTAAAVTCSESESATWTTELLLLWNRHLGMETMQWALCKLSCLWVTVNPQTHGHSIKAWLKDVVHSLGSLWYFKLQEIAFFFFLFLIIVRWHESVILKWSFNLIKINGQIYALIYSCMLSE